MKRDVELFRQILIESENQPPSLKGHTIEIPGHTSEETYEHALLLQDAGLIEARFHKSIPVFVVLRLTNEGHDFLAAAKQDTLWVQANDAVRKNIGAVTVAALKTALSEIVQKALSQYG